MEKYHTMNTKDVLKSLDSDAKGINEKEASSRLGKYGENSIKEKDGISPLKIFLDQFTSILIIILIIASVIAIIAGELLDGVLIIIIVVANGIFGFVQDYKAEKSIEALKKLSRPTARVIRGGATIEIPARFIVPGDIIILNEGDRIPADGRLIEGFDLSVDESALTGESMDVSKTTKAINDTSLPERKNMVYMNTDISRGKGKAVVVATGMETEIGKIATSLQTIEKDKTPFQERIDALGKQIGIAILIITAIVFMTHVMIHTSDILTIFLISISLAVAAIPEGLPAVTTLSLALGVKRMSKRNALVRRLPIVEGLGSVDIICSDKTGTITEGKMKVRKIYFSEKLYDFPNKTVKKEKMKFLLLANTLCNNVTVSSKKEMLGDPTEKALLLFSNNYLNKDKTDSEYPRTNEVAFSSERKMMSTVNKKGSDHFVFSKGAPEVILEKCTKIFVNGRSIPLTAQKKKEILKVNENMASQALRVLGFAFKKGDKNIEKNLVFLGLEGMIDAPRKEAKDAIRLCKQSGIRVIMITGDNKITAQAIANDVGISGDALEGVDIENYSEKEMEEAVKKINIFSRVSPAHKVKILEALKKEDHNVAMTGDGVNDAPALKSADVGVAMGIKGTDVAKQTSDMILLDDNFATIVSAVHEGRRIFDNVKKFVMYLLGANFAEVAIVFIASLFGQIALAATHLLWINLLTDGMPALALGADPAGKNIMGKRSKGEDEVLNKSMIYSIVTIGVLITAVVLYLFFTVDPAKAMTIAFTSLVVMELAKIYVIRKRFGSSPFSNRYLSLAVIGSFILQLIVIYSPLNTVFKVVPLGLNDWVLILIGTAATSLASFAIIRKFK
ncbi:calcium-translocating P-type ATPase, PMCA-type [Candidatus Aenigmatarchaeota archaeon]